jgi:hypothetical protein
MYIINNGKYNLLTLNLISYKVECNVFLTKDCSNIIRDKILFLFYIWKKLPLGNKANSTLKYKYSKELFKL